MTYLLYAGAAVLTAVFGCIYGIGKGKYGNKVLVFKALATLSAMSPAIAAAVEKGGTHRWLVVLGLALCMTADVLLELWVLSGVLAFACAHVCLIAAFGAAVQVRWYTLVLAPGFYLVFFLGFHQWLPKFGRLLIPAVTYPALLCSMAALAVTFAIQQPGIHGVTAGIGGMLFVVSDFILGYRMLEQRKEWIFRAAVLVFYFSSVYLIAV